MGNCLSRGILLFIIALFAVTGCADIAPAAPVKKTAAAPTTEETEGDSKLTIVFPQATTELVGGQSLRVTALLKQSENLPVKDALVTAELWTPAGELFATLPCLHKGAGRYLADSISLPLRDSQGIWRVVAQATWADGLAVEADEQFIGLNSYSEKLQQLFGFWIELTDLFPYNVSNADDPRLKTYDYADGAYVILANNLAPGTINNAFVILDVHWRQQEFPQDQTAAVDYALSLAGPHRITLDIPATALTAERDDFHGWPAWRVSGWWPTENALGNPENEAPLDWMIFRCPGSDWLWTILVTTNSPQHMDDLLSIRETFACSPN